MTAARMLPPVKRSEEDDAEGAGEARCEHCDNPLLPGQSRYCCPGCRAVAGLLRASGLDRYYVLRDGPGEPIGERQKEGSEMAFIEALEERQQAGEEELAVDVQGMRCAACVWLMEELFERKEGGGEILINPALGQIRLRVAPGFPLREYLEEVTRFGYRVGPARKESDQGSDGLMGRMGITIALAGNAMMFSLAIYLGLDEGPLYTLFTRLTFALAAAAVVIGGSLFFRTAWEGLKRGALHLDLPIALGILLSFAGSSVSLFFGDGDAAYFDSVTVFIALMLVGRWLSERAVSRNRSQLLVAEEVGALLTRRVVASAEGGPRQERIRCDGIRLGDRLLIHPGELVPVRATLRGGSALFSLAWTSGESEPRSIASGEEIPSGAFLAGGKSVEVEALERLEGSILPSLLAAPAGRARPKSRFWAGISRFYVIFVLSSAVLGALASYGLGADPWSALEVAISILVVTCPCAFGLATPVAYELAHALLRRDGVFVRRADLLERIRDVRTVVFDKTGTLTTGALRLADPAPLRAVGQEGRAILLALSGRSGHPKAESLREALEGELAGDEEDALPHLELAAEEHLGDGIEARHRGRLHRLGAARWAAPGALADQGTREAQGAQGAQGARGALDAADLVYSVDGELRASFRFDETLRPGAAEEVEALHERGLHTYILSGDGREAVVRVARSLGLSEDRLLAEQSPEDKATFLRAHEEERCLMIGDGVNDGPAFDAAHCSGTPAIDRPFMPARADFFLTRAGLSPVSRILRVAERLAQIVRRNLGFAFAYNGLAIALAVAGLMRPWMAAALMPLSSLLILAHTRLSFASLKGADRTGKQA